MAQFTQNKMINAMTIILNNTDPKVNKLLEYKIVLIQISFYDRIM